MELQNNGLCHSYQPVKNWHLQLPDDSHFSPVGIALNSKNQLVIFSRAAREWTVRLAQPYTCITEKTILVADAATGKIVSSLGNDLFVTPHGLCVDADDNTWVTDVELQQVFKFNAAGALLMTLGHAGIAGTDDVHFNMPTGVAVAGDGCVYVSDGYGNSRIVKFSATGTFLLQWGFHGTGAAAFDIPHAITLDPLGHVYVADRENRRIQVFDSNGKWLKILGDKSFGSLCSMAYDIKNEQLVAVDDLASATNEHSGSDVIIFENGGNSFTKFGRSGAYDGPAGWYHDVAVDSSGNIFTADLLGNTILKFEKKPGLQ